MNVPAHIAIIMDGNGRWAKEKGMVRLKGHQAGMEALHDIVECCSDLGVSYLTVYAFSTENWKRPAEEVSGIFKLKQALRSQPFCSKALRKTFSVRPHSSPQVQAK